MKRHIHTPSTHFLRNSLCMIFLVFSYLGQANSVVGYPDTNMAPPSELMGGDIVNGADLYVIDGEMGTANMVSVDPNTLIRLEIDNELPPFNWYQYDIELKVSPILADGSTGNSYLQKLTVEYNPNGNTGNFTDMVVHKMFGRHGAYVSVESIATTDLNTNVITSVTPDNVKLSLEFSADRYFQLSTGVVNFNAIQILPSPSNPCAILLSWNPVIGAKEYELEWTWVDNYGDIASGAPTDLPANQIDLTIREFELNNTRVQINPVDENSMTVEYEIPLVYSRGYLVFRARAVGRFLDDVSVPFYGDWNSVETATHVDDWENYHIVLSHEQLKNWQFQASYAEDGKKKEVVSYFDGTLRNRQTVTKINSDDNAIVGEVFYDNQGRPAIEVLPVPADNDKITYYNDFNRNLDDVKYSQYDFDWDAIEGSINCSLDLSGMIEKIGSSKYYSGNNKATGNFQDYVPDARLFPFSQIEYTPDNTGRVRRKSGVGVEHQLGSGNEMKYFYSQPTTSFELNRIFGYQVGRLNHYKKNTVVDPNGQTSVSYLDPQGRTIATALAGGNPKTAQGQDILIGLDDETNDELHDLIQVDLLEGNESYSTGRFELLNDGLRINKQITAIQNNSEYEFEYGFTGGTFVFNDSCTVEFPYVYDLKVSLIDDCGLELFNPDGILEGAFNNEPGITNFDLTTLTANLDVGEYSLVKDLLVNEEVIEQYWQQFLDNASENCLLTQEDFILINFDCSMIDCSIVSQGQTAYIASKLAVAYEEGVQYNYVGGSLTFPAGVPLELQAEITAFHDGLVEAYPIVTEFCENKTICNINERTLLADMSPEGQYGGVVIDVDPATGESLHTISDPLSVFNDGSGTVPNGIYYNGTSGNHDWRHPITDYLDANGDVSYIEVISQNGITTGPDAIWSPEVIELASIESIDGLFFVVPEQLANIDDFLTAWNPNWAKSLLEYHPEYCYLDYSRAVCDQREDIGTLGEMNSFEFDDYLRTVSTYQDAVDHGFIGTGFLQLMDLDPLFNNEFASENSSLTDFQALREAIMNHALTENFDGLGDDLLAPNIFGILSYSYAVVKFGSLMDLDDITSLPNSAGGLYGASEIGGLNDADKDEVWIQYVNNYIGLKSKIYDASISIHAIKGGCFNSCLDGDIISQDILDMAGDDYGIDISSGTYHYTTPISSYLDVPFNSSTIGGVIDSEDNPPSNTLCPNSLYEEKIKRFPGSTYLYTAEILDGDGDGIDDTTGTTYYEQTGKCKVQLDLEVFIRGFFEERKENGQSITANLPFSGPYFTIDLFEELGGVEGDDPTLQGQISGGGNLLTILIGNLSNPKCGDPITLQAPAGLSWNNYDSSWEFKDLDGLTELYYDSDPTLEETGKWRYEILAKVLVGGNITEYVLTGETCTELNNCLEECNDVCDPQFTIQVKSDLVALLNRLLTNEFLNTTTNIPINGFTEYTNSFLPEFYDFPVNPEYRYNNGSFQFDLHVDGSGSALIYTMDGNYDNASSFIDEFLDIRFEAVADPNPPSPAHNITLIYRDLSGNIIEDTGLLAYVKHVLLDACIDEDEQIHLAFNMQVPGPFTTADRISVMNGLVDFHNNVLVGENVVVSGNDDHQTSSGNPLAIRFQSAEKTPVPTVVWESSSEAKTNPWFYRNQNSAYTNAFTRTLEALVNGTGTSNISAQDGQPIDEIDVQFFIQGYHRFNGIAPIQTYYQNFLNTKASKAFFILIDEELNLYDTSTNSAMGKLDFIGNLIGGTPTSYDTTGSIFNSDYASFDSDDPNFELNITNFLTNAYQEIDNGPADPCTTNIMQSDGSFMGVEAFSSQILANCNNSAANLWDAVGWSQENVSPDFWMPISQYPPGFENTCGYFPQSAPDSPDGGAFLAFAVDQSYHGEGAQTNVSDLIVGETYTISFYQTNLGRVQDGTNPDARLRFKVTFNGEVKYTPFMSFQGFGNQTWQEINLLFDATSTSSTLKIRAEWDVDNPAYDKGYLGLDGVRVLNCEGVETACECVVQTVRPVSCNDKWDDYIEYLDFVENTYPNGEGDDPATYTVWESNTISGLQLPELFTEEVFCGMNFGYITDNYIYYLERINTLYGVDSSDHPLFMGIGEFGDTDLNYGFDDPETTPIEMQLVIDEYLASITLDGDNEPNVSWKIFINGSDEEPVISGWIADNDPCIPAPMIPEVLIEIPEPTDPCEDIIETLTEAYSHDSYLQYLENLKAQFIEEYVNGAIENAEEVFNMKYPDKEYQYTLYYYDQAGNLVQTVPPEGADRLGNDLDIENKEILNQKINDDREFETTNTDLPKHSYKTQYRYNSLNQLVWQKTPDGGETRFAYDALGRIIASQNAKQTANTINDLFSYTLYDELGRIIEAGETYQNINNWAFGGSYYISDNGQLIHSTSGIIGSLDVPVDSFLSFVIRKEITKTFYDQMLSGKADLFEDYSNNDRNRVTAIQYINDSNSPTRDYFTNAIYYDYDIHGNVKEMITEINHAFLDKNNQNVKKVFYDYDLISGNVNQVTYQRGKPDQFIHRYDYDADNRIVSVHTSDNGVVWETDANYKYYEHGPLARVLVGDKEVQGMDYAYTLQGWLKGVNNEVLNRKDMAGDSNANTVGTDAYAYTLSYFDKDYSPRISGVGNPFQTSISLYSANPQLFNGNIRGMTTALMDTKENPMDIAYNTYIYDQLNRIVGMKNSEGKPTGGGPNAGGVDASYSYDRNGNLQELYRSARTSKGSIASMDKLTYKYFSDAAGNPTNRLQIVGDDIPDNAFANIDVDNHKSDYVYDEIGQLIQDADEGIKDIQWRVDGKVAMVTKTDGQEITFEYDGLGNRLSKYNKNERKTTYYLRDAQGNVMTVYNLLEQFRDARFMLDEQHIYGSSRLGLQEPAINLTPRVGTVTTEKPTEFDRLVGDKRYELSNHLGNVLEVINDKKLPILSGGDLKYFTPDVQAQNDYYPFGMLIPTRNSSIDGYRYGFQGQEKDDEIKGEGNSINYKYRMHDPRIGRFFATDPMESIYNWYSPYAFSGNRVIDAIEMEGLQPFTKTKGKTLVAGIKFKVSNETDINGEVVNEILDRLKIKFKTQLSKKIKGHYNQLEGAVVIDNKASYEILFLPKEEIRKRLVAEGLMSEEDSKDSNIIVSAMANGIGGDKIYVSDETLGGLIGDWIGGEGGFLDHEKEDLDRAANTIFHEIGHLLGLLHTYQEYKDEIPVDVNGKVVLQLSSIKKLWDFSKKEIEQGTFNMPGSATRILAENIMTLGQEGNDLILRLELQDIMDDVETGETGFNLRNDQIEEIYKTIKKYVDENK